MQNEISMTTITDGFEPYTTTDALYIHKCELCGKEFDLYKGEGWGESYNAGGMLPKTRYVCMECIKSREE